jgi:Mrp family chromosome partitioning ATPase
MSGLMNMQGNSILFTSALPQEGRSTSLLSMAYYLLSLKRRVIILDMDFFRPSLERLTHIQCPAGITELLASDDPYQSYIRTNKAGLALLSAGRADMYVPDFMHSRKFHDLLKSLKSDYDYVLIDGGPILTRTDALAIADFVDGIIVVAHWLKTSRKDLSNLVETTAHLHKKILGVILNRVDIKKYKSMTEGSDFILPKIVPA